MLPDIPGEPIAGPVAGGDIPEPPPPGSVSPKKLAWARRKRTFKRNWAIYRSSWMGIAGMIVLIGFVATALLAPLYVSEADLDKNTAREAGIPAAPIKPSMLITDEYIQEYIDTNTSNPEVAAKWTAELKEMQGTWTFPLGTDASGRSMLKLMVWGARISLIVGLMATFMTMIIGAGVGISAGFFGGKIDAVLERLTDWFLVIPWVPLAIVLASLLGPSLWNIILIIGITSWAVTARTVRSQALTVATRPFVERGRALGAGNWHIITRHMLPNLTPIILANTVLTVAIVILSESYLSFLGLGDPTSVSWGGLLDQAGNASSMTGGYWWYVFPPGLAITAAALGFSMVGVAVEEVANPKLRKR